MLALIDCIAFSGLSPEQVDVVACHKHVPVIVAAEWAEGALDQPQGVEEVEDLLASEAMAACERHMACAETRAHALAEFRTTHHLDA